jgi:hypothetical protein
MSHVDVIQGRRYADEMLSTMTVSPMDKLVAGLPNWQHTTAKHLINTASQRLAEGMNPDYQRGIIARARESME